MSQAYQPLGSFSELPEIQIDGQIHTRAGADPGSLHQKLRNEAALLAMDQLGAITLEGPDAAEFLQRICSQDAQGMAPGSGARACLLSGKGKLLAAFWLWRPAHERFLLEVDRPRSEAVLGILDRYLFSENCRIRDLSPELAVIGVVGPGAPELVDGAPAAGQVVARGGGHLVHSTELGVPSIRFVAPRDEADSLARELADSGLPLGGFEDFEALRIDACVPRFGLDADENTIPLEVNLDELALRSIVYDANGDEFDVLYDVENRAEVTLDQVSDELLTTVI
ncbi:MAG: hypothetical protein ACE5F1_22640, partial [Planctomycetota bacterium]